MNNFKYIYLDMDGVIVDFIGGVERVFGKPKEPPTCWNFGKWYGLSERVMWNILQPAHDRNQIREFWTGLRMYPWATSLITELEQFNIKILLTTTPSKAPESSSGKMAWIDTHMYKYSRSFIITPIKEALSKDGILIDDSESNVDKFRKEDGTAILFPQPWNCHGVEQDNRVVYTINLLREYTQ